MSISVCLTLACRFQSRMAAVAELSFLLFALTNNIHAEELIFVRKERQSYTFRPPKEGSFCLISTFVVGEGKQVLLNTSDLWYQNSTAPEHLKERLPAVRKMNDSSYMIHNLTHSHSGLYQEQCWMEGNVTYEKNVRIVVCGTINNYTCIEGNLGESFELPCKEAADNLTVQWLQDNLRYEEETWTNVFESSTSSLMDVQERAFKVVKNTSALAVTSYKFIKSDYYICLVMDKERCVSGHPVCIFMSQETLYHSVGERAVLNCTDLSDQPPLWKKYNKTRLNYTVVGQNYTLGFSSLTLNDSALYLCEYSIKWKYHLLLVCPKFGPPAVVFFSEGEEITLRCNSTANVIKHWFMKSNQTEGRVIHLNAQMPDEGSRVRISPLGLVLANVSLENTGEYWCALVVDYFRCMSASKILLVHREPESEGRTGHAVRSSLLSAALLTLCAAVVAVIRRTRRGEQSAAV